MKAMIWPAGDVNDATSQYRLYLPGQALKEQGADVVVDTAGPTLAWDREWHGPEPPPDARIMALAKKPDADTIIMQRPGRRWWADVIPFLQEAGCRVVVDVDDLFTKIHQKNIALGAYDPKLREHSNYQWIAEACRRADLVTCTTPALLSHYGFGHGMVIPNFVPRGYLGLHAEKMRETAGWTGSTATHPEDLQVTRGAIGRVIADRGWRFHVVGTGVGVKDALELKDEPSNTGEWVPFGEYPGRMAEISLGIVPLADSPFNKAKSALKMMEFASLGVPVVASATPDNQRMAAEGVGVTVGHPSHWRKTFSKLVSNPAYREDLAGRSRERMAEFTYENQCWRWGFAWGLDRERIKAAAGR